MEKIANKKSILFLVLWLVVFVLYLPAAKAGFVDDFTGWLNAISTQGFWEYINRTHFEGKSLFQFTQFTTYIFYKLFGANAWAWHLLHVTLQALNAYLWFVLSSKIFSDTGIKYGKQIAIAGVLLFCVSPYLSEVIVWEPSFHYLQGFLLILLILLQLQQFQYSGKAKHAWWAGFIFLLSTYSLELFYLTPFLTLTLAVYYRFGLGYDKIIFRKALVWFFLPQVILLIAHFSVYHSVYGEWLPHLKGDAFEHSWHYYLSKPAKYIFQVALLGRYFPAGVKNIIYDLTESTKAIAVVVSFIVLVVGFILLLFRKFSSHFKAASILFIWILPVLVIMGPLWFPIVQPYVFFDRYLYLLDAFVIMLGCLLLNQLVKRTIFWLGVSAYGLMSIYFTFQTNKYWQISAAIIDNLIYTIPEANDKTIILLNPPENLQGIPMLDATPEGEFKLAHNEFASKKINTPIYDAMAFNMLTPQDGANVKVLNDSAVGVTLNQWGTWWWYNAQGGISYKNNDYSINMVDAGHYYELKLNKPLSAYLLLYMVDGQWKIVNPAIKNEVQK